MEFTIDEARSQIGKRVKTTKAYASIPLGRGGSVIGAGPTVAEGSDQIVVQIEFSGQWRTNPHDTHHSMKPRTHEFTKDEWDNSIEVTSGGGSNGHVSSGVLDTHAQHYRHLL